jgi:hypothetical protein
MQATFAGTSLCSDLEGDALAVSAERDLDSYVPAGAARVSLGRAVALPPSVAFSARRHVSSVGAALLAMAGPAGLANQGALTCTEDDGAINLSDACLSSARSTLAGLAVTTDFTFVGEALS